MSGLWQRPRGLCQTTKQMEQKNVSIKMNATCDRCNYAHGLHINRTPQIFKWIFHQDRRQQKTQLNMWHARIRRTSQKDTIATIVVWPLPAKVRDECFDRGWIAAANEINNIYYGPGLEHKKVHSSQRRPRHGIKDQVEEFLWQESR